MSPLPAVTIAIASIVVAVILLRYRSDHKNRRLNEQITNEMPSGVITVNRKGSIIGHNRASERIFEGTLANTSLREMVRESEKLQNLLDRCLNSGDVFTRVEFSVPIAHQHEKRIGINLSPITNEQGGIEGAICLLSDLTEIVDLQNQVKLKENFAALGEMSAGIAHEFKNSIATILGYAQLSDGETNVQVLQDYAKEIQKESRSMSTMVADFLNFAKPVNPSILDVDISELLDSVIADVRNSRPGNYEIIRKAQASAIVPCDPTLTRQMFLNLMLNAIEAVSENADGGGRISVSMEHVTERDASTVRVAIEDNGRGIPTHELTKIFYPFFTTKTHGTGLGLSLVQKIVMAHNGRIEAQNADPRGARFVVTLPLKELSS
jgi:PAS domain S-box-containing protein